MNLLTVSPLQVDLLLRKFFVLVGVISWIALSRGNNERSTKSHELNTKLYELFELPRVVVHSCHAPPDTNNNRDANCVLVLGEGSLSQMRLLPALLTSNWFLRHCPRDREAVWLGACGSRTLPFFIRHKLHFDARWADACAVFRF